jgi:hypothetical protein
MYDESKLNEAMNESEHVRPAAEQIPIIKLEGNKGVFTKRSVGEDGYEPQKEMGQTFSGVIVGIRMSLNFFGKKYQLNTPEYGKTTDNTILFRRQGKGDKGKKIDEGSAFSLKVRHEELREQRILYMLVGKELVKFQCKGAGLSHWFALLKELGKKKLHTYNVVVKLDPNAERNEEMGKDYFAPNFTIERELTPEAIEKTIAPQILKLKEQFDAISRFQTSRAKVAEVADEPARDEVPTIQVEGEELPPIQDDEDGDY